MLKDMIQRITDKYSKNGEWITKKRAETKYINAETGEEVDLPKAIMENIPYRKKEYTVEVSEGMNRDYWKSTAGNAISPLFSLISMAQMRPDGVWDGD